MTYELSLALHDSRMADTAWKEHAAVIRRCGANAANWVGTGDLIGRVQSCDARFSALTGKIIGVYQESEDNG